MVNAGSLFRDATTVTEELCVRRETILRTFGSCLTGRLSSHVRIQRTYCGSRDDEHTRRAGQLCDALFTFSRTLQLAALSGTSDNIMSAGLVRFCVLARQRRHRRRRPSRSISWVTIR